MDARSISNNKHTLTRLSAVLLVIVPLLSACARQTQPARIEEMTFQSGEFTLVGDLRTPAGTGPFPVVLFVHGSDDADRTLFGYYLPVMERMLRAGYAVFSWDKPGYGESTGQLRARHVYHQRAQIVLDAIEVLQARPDIDPGRIGLWGISQASYVMPLVLSQSEDVAFMICVSCGGMSGHDLGVYQITTFAMFCADVLEEDADQRTALFAELEEARKLETYEQYLHYREVLDALVDISPYRDKLLDFLSKNGGGGVVPEEAWLKNDPEIERWWNPVEVLEQLRIPVLAIFGDKDSNTDPMQGAYAWRKALEKAGNRDFRVELLPGVDHLVAPSESSCINDQAETIDQVLQEQGYGPQDESLALFQREPGQHTPLSAWPYAPGYLDLIEEWLRGLPE
jgi:pimeloyl-ACP methyl ester carboxylesterase